MFRIFTRRKSSPAPHAPADAAIAAAAVDCSMTAVDSDASSQRQELLNQLLALSPPPVPPQHAEQAASAADAFVRAGAAEAAAGPPPVAASGVVQRHKRFRLPSSRVVSHTRHALTRHAKQLARKANEHEQLITKVTYSLGVLGFGIFCFLLGSRPQDIPFVYAAFFLVATPLRWVYYRAKKWHYFLLDFCYYANVICTFYLLFFSKNEKLFLVCFAFSEGPLAWALIVWRCSLVFSSLDKIVSVLIHLLPGTVIFIIRWWDPATLAHHAADETGPWPAWPQVDSARELWLWMLAVPLAAYAVWQIVYWAVVHGLRNKRLLRDPEVLTSFRELSRKASRANNVWWKLSGVLGDDRRFLMYGLLQALFTIATMALTVPMFQSYRLHMAFQFFKVITSVWNGGNFFLEVMPRQLQSRAAARRHQHSPLRRASRSSGGSSSSLCADGSASDSDAAVSLRTAGAEAAATTATDLARRDIGVSGSCAKDAALVCNGKAVCVATTDAAKAHPSRSVQSAGPGAAAAAASAASATPVSTEPDCSPVGWQMQQQQLLLQNFQQQLPRGECSATVAGCNHDDAPRCQTCGQPLPCMPLLPSELCLSPDPALTASIDRPGSVNGSTELEAGRGRGNGSWQDHREQHFQHARRHSWDCDADTQGEPTCADFCVHPLSAANEAHAAKAMAAWEGMRRRTGWQQQSEPTYREGNRTGSGRWQASPHLGSVPCAG